MNCMAWLRFRLLLSRVLLLWSMTWRRRQSRACLALIPCLPALMSLRSIEVFRPLSERSIRVGAPTLDLSSPSEWLVHSAPGSIMFCAATKPQVPQVVSPRVSSVSQSTEPHRLHGPETDSVPRARLGRDAGLMSTTLRRGRPFSALIFSTIGCIVIELAYESSFLQCSTVR